jgi:hypothetical protein
VGEGSERQRGELHAERFRSSERNGERKEGERERSERRMDRGTGLPSSHAKRGGVGERGRG